MISVVSYVLFFDARVIKTLGLLAVERRNLVLNFFVVLVAHTCHFVVTALHVYCFQYRNMGPGTRRYLYIYLLQI